MKKILASTLLLLLGESYVSGNAAVLTSKDCSKVSSCSDCINYINDDMLDGTKCIPITSGNGCMSWSDVQDKKAAINYSCNWSTVPSWESTEVTQLIKMPTWARYAYDAKTGDTRLADMKIFENVALETKMVVGYDAASNSIISTFRGTSNIVNWIEDADFFKTDYNQPGCTSCGVHRGFLNAYHSLSDQYLPYLKSLASKHSGATMVVVGHSLGGAEATLAAVDVQQMGYKVYLYTYGSPRVGDESFANFVDGLITATNLRGVYKNDPVPTVPGHSLGFAHVGTEIHFYDCSKSYLVYPQYQEDTPLTDLFAADDHEGYFCLTGTALEEAQAFLQ